MQTNTEKQGWKTACDNIPSHSCDFTYLPTMFLLPSTMTSLDDNEFYCRDRCSHPDHSACLICDST
jgi:hypothetical protein